MNRTTIDWAVISSEAPTYQYHCAFREMKDR